MKPIEIDKDDDMEVLVKKIKILIDDIYIKFSLLNRDVYDFVSEDVLPQNAVTSIDADELTS